MTLLKSRARLAHALLPASLAALAALSPGAQALSSDPATYPGRPARIIVPYPPGGPTDVAARILGVELSKRLGQTFIVENRAGAGGMIGAGEVARANPDGYTLLVNASAHVIYPAIFKTVPFDVLNDFSPISQLVSVPLLMVVSPSTPANNIKELIAYGKANPGKLSFASAGIGGAPHLAGALFKQMTGLDAVHVSYKGSAPALTDLIGGQVNFMFDSMSSSLAHVKSGKLRAFGVSTGKRSELVPDVPTIAESGVPGYELPNWYGFWAPKGTPEVIVNKLYAATAAAFADPTVAERIRALGAEPATSRPQVFGAFTVREKAKWGQIAIDSGAEKE